MNSDDFEITINPQMQNWDMHYGNSVTDSSFTLSAPEIFTRYPDLSSREVREGLGVDIVQGIRRVIDEGE